ncbi:hypothetical protein T484DRAFT_1980491, partial [Baffinella frigidus]
MEAAMRPPAAAGAPARRGGEEKRCSGGSADATTSPKSSSPPGSRRSITGVGLVAMQLAGVASPGWSRSSGSSSGSDGEGDSIQPRVTASARPGPGPVAQPAALPPPSLGADSVAEWIASSKFAVTVRPRGSPAAVAPPREEAAARGRAGDEAPRAAARFPGPGLRKHVPPLQKGGYFDGQGKTRWGEDEEGHDSDDGESVFSCATTASRLSIDSLRSHASSSSAVSARRPPTRAMQIAAQLRLETAHLPPISHTPAGDRSSRGSTTSTGSTSPSSGSSDDGGGVDNSVLGVCDSEGGGGGGGGWRDDVPQFCMGVKWLIRNNKLVVGSFSAWSVADKLGVKHGDILRSVDGADVLAMVSAPDGTHPAMRLLSGDYGSLCNLRFMRVDQEQVKAMMVKSAAGGAAGAGAAAPLKLMDVAVGVPRLISVSAGQNLSV